ncbi:MAG: metallophosphoesterase [Halobacteria archaeon]
MKVVHTGDTHLGYKQYGCTERRRDFVSAFRDVAEDAVESEAEVLVHAGDLFHSRNPRLDDIIEVIDIFRYLDRNDVRSLTVVGNHERKRSSQWVDLLENLGVVDRLSQEPIEIESSAFYGVDYVPPSKIGGFDYSFEDSGAERKFLVLHGRFEPFPYGEWDLREFVRESNVDWDGFLLGDYHHYEFEYVEDVPATYCGSTERASAEEREARGYNVLETGELNFTRRSIDTRDFIFVEVEIDEAVTEVSANGKVIERAKDYDIEDSVVLIDIEGDGDANVAQSEVEKELLRDGALVTRIKDRREIEDEDSDVEVTFSDPDDAVRERIRGMELSSMAVEVDDVVRGDDVPDSNVADSVENEVMEAVEEDVGQLRDSAEIEPERNADAEPTESGDIVADGDSLKSIEKGNDGGSDESRDGKNDGESDGESDLSGVGDDGGNGSFSKEEDAGKDSPGKEENGEDGDVSGSADKGQSSMEDWT